MKKFVLWIISLALGAAGVAMLGSMLLPVWIMGGRHVSTAEHLDSSGASIVELGPIERQGNTIIVPVDVIAAKDAPIAGTYTRVRGKLIVAELYVYVDATYGISKYGWRFPLPWRYGKDVVTVEFPSDQVHTLRRRFNVAECCTPPPWQWQARRLAPESSNVQVSDATRAAAESSVAQALAAAHAAPALSPLDAATPLQKAILLARPGDSLLQFQSQLSPSEAADPMIKYEIRRADLGVRLFLTADAKVKRARFEWPYAGSIGGIKMGDSIDDVRRTLGVPGKPSEDVHQRFQQASVYFDRVAGFSAQVDLDDAHRVKTVILR